MITLSCCDDQGGVDGAAMIVTDKDKKINVRNLFIDMGKKWL